MKKLPYNSPLLRAFTFVMAVWVFVLFIFAPVNDIALSNNKIGSKITVADATFILNLEAPSGKHSLPKASVLKFPSGTLEMLLFLVASDLQEYSATFLRCFIQNVSFIYISAKGP